MQAPEVDAREMTRTSIRTILLSLEEERALVQRSQAGDHDAFRALVEQHRAFAECVATKVVYRYVPLLLEKMELVADVVQEAFLVAWECLPDYDVSRETRFGAWLGSIVFHQARWLSQREWRPSHHREALIERYGNNDEEDIERLALQREEHTTIHEAVQRLPKKYQVLVHLHHLEEVGVPECAASLSLSLTVAKTRLQFARKLLKAQLVQMGLEREEGLKLTHKLSPAAIEEICTSSERGYLLAKKYHISQVYVCALRRKARREHAQEQNHAALAS